MAKKYPEFQAPDGEYAGDLAAGDAWAILETDPDAVLVDVRTEVEWNLIGKPDLSGLSKEPVYLQWVTLQGVNADFEKQLDEALAQRQTKKAAPILFMCQSGGRSKISAIQCTGLGYQNCYNIADGFEGGLDEHQHRNSVSGWKVAGLPWTQT
jgi:rhodanese-related sulfurtransferase